MELQLQKHSLTLLFLLNINETDVKTLEAGDLDSDQVWGLLIDLDNRGLVSLTKSDASIKPLGKVLLKSHFNYLEGKFVEYIQRKQTYLSEYANITDFITANFVKPNPTSDYTTNDRDFAVYFIKHLKKKGLVKYNEETLSHVNYWYVDDNPPTIKRWFHNLDKPLYIALTDPTKTQQEKQEAQPNMGHYIVAQGNVIIGNNNNQSSSNDDKIIYNPVNINTNAKKSKTYKNIFIGIIITVVGGVIVMAIGWYFKLNAVRP